jgi:energy-coupling factor transporter transmembrane protein EcfT
MARVSPFGFCPGDTLVHRLDPRFKMLFLVALSLSGLNAGPAHLALVAAGALLLLSRAGVSPAAVFR